MSYSAEDLYALLNRGLFLMERLSADDRLYWLAAGQAGQVLGAANPALGAAFAREADEWESQLFAQSLLGPIALPQEYKDLVVRMIAAVASPEVVAWQRERVEEAFGSE